MKNLEVIFMFILAIFIFSSVASSQTPQPLYLNFSTYLGGSAFEQARDVAIDSQGNIYVTGGTKSQNFKTTVGPAFNSDSCPSLGTGGSMDVFVVKFSPSGQLIWSRFFGGPCYDRAYGIEVDSQGYVYIGGRAGELLPTTPGVVQPNFAGDLTNNALYGKQDGFIAKISPDGSQVIWATYFGTSGSDVLRDIDIDNSGNVYAGVTGTPYLFPAGIITSNAFQPTIKGASDGVIAKISSDGKQVLFASYIGGTLDDGQAPAIRADTSGNIYIAMGVKSIDITTSSNAFQKTNGGGLFDLFLMKINPDATSPSSSLIYATYFGGNGEESSETHYLNFDQSGNAYVSGYTNSNNLPISGVPGFKKTNSGDYDAYVAKISSDGSSLLAGTYLGGSGGEGIQGIAIDNTGVYVGGTTTSTNFPMSSSGYQQTYGGGAQDIFMTKLSLNLDQILYSTYYGGSGDDEGRSLMIGNNSVVSVGQTDSANFNTLNPYQSNNAGNADLAVIKFLFSQAPSTDTTLPTVSITSPTGGTQSGVITITAIASDNVAVAGVQFKVDGNNYGNEDTTSPYSVSLNTSTLTNSNHVITVVARDVAGNIATATGVTVTVNNIIQPATCSDGTAQNSCSSNKPLYCNSRLQLVSSCSTNSCGCLVGQQCNQTSQVCYTSTQNTTITTIASEKRNRMTLPWGSIALVIVLIIIILVWHLKKRRAMLQTRSF